MWCDQRDRLGRRGRRGLFGLMLGHLASLILLQGQMVPNSPHERTMANQWCLWHCDMAITFNSCPLIIPKEAYPGKGQEEARGCPERAWWRWVAQTHTQEHRKLHHHMSLSSSLCLSTDSLGTRPSHVVIICMDLSIISRFLSCLTNTWINKVLKEAAAHFSSSFFFFFR